MVETSKMNDTTLIAFFELLKDSIYKDNKITKQYDDVDWNRLFKLAVTNNLLSIMYTSAMKYGIHEMPEELRKSMKMLSLQNMLLESHKYLAIRKIVDKVEEENFSLIFFKGIILAELYPYHLLRTSDDTDVFLDKADKEKAIKILEELGYIRNEEHSKDTVPVYVNQDLGHVVELHFSLWEDYKGPQMNLLDRMELTNVEKLVKRNVFGIDILSMGYEDHLIYQMFHIIKHFATQSVGVRYLSDITLYINKYYEYIDIPSFWNKIKTLGYEKFCYTFFQLCVELLGMDSRILQEAKSVTGADKIQLLYDMISPIGETRDNMASWQIYSLITPYLQGDATVSDSKFIRKVKILFPGTNALPDRCSYARKYPILLPVAWMHRIIGWLYRYIRHYISRKYLTEGDMYGVGGKLSAAEYRLSLMKEMGLVTNKNNKNL